MQVSTERLSEQILRSPCEPFTAKDLSRLLSRMDARVSEKEAEGILEQSPYVYALDGGLYVTRAGAFTGELFSIKPTAAEVRLGILVPGDRCLPFVDEDMMPTELTFFVGTERLPKKSGTFDSDLAIDLHLLYGEEYAPQYIASDPANKDVDFVDRGFELPATVSLTGFDMRVLFDRLAFCEGDRLLCRVTDWDKGYVELSVIHSHNDVFDSSPDAKKRLAWYQTLEQCLLESFDSAGPCATIEEQLEIVFFDNLERLCVPECGSVEEFLLRYAKKVGIAPYGVETRIWRKGEQVPAVGKWNDAQLALFDQLDFITLESRAIYSTPDFVYDEFLRDMYYARKNDIDELFAYIYPPEYAFSKVQKRRLLLHLNERNAIIAPEYNWFADQQKGPVRRETLDLYRRVSTLAYRIECSHGKLELYPQQELVILSQLNGHLMRMIISLGSDQHVDEDADALMLSLEGMRGTFEDIEDILESAFETQRLSQFKVRK